jgi:hypothetical protein
MVDKKLDPETIERTTESKQQFTKKQLLDAKANAQATIAEVDAMLLLLK